MEKKKIAVFANGWSNEYLEAVLEGIRAEAKKDGVDIFVFFTYSSWGDGFSASKSTLNIFHLANPSDYDGAIMLTNTFNFSDEQERVCSLFKDKGIPLLSTGVKIDGLPFFGNSNYEGMMELSNHIIEKHNVKKVVYLSGIEGNHENIERKRALEDSLKAHGLSLLDTIQGDFSFYGAYNSVGAWLDKHSELPDAFVCANDHSAIGTCTILCDKGYRVPEDVIVTGYDNISVAQVNVPMMSTVAMDISNSGRDLYIELKKQIDNPDPSFEKLYPTHFVPAETCGCTPTKQQLEIRLKKLQKRYYDKTFDDMKNIFFQNIRFALAKVESKEEFYEIAKERFDELIAIGPDYSMCIEPDFFKLDDEHYPERIRGYSHNMDIIYHKENGKPVSPFSFDSKYVVPHYRHEEGESNIYFISPLSSMNYVIGYCVIKNSTEMVYDLSFRNYLTNMSTLLYNIRQYIFAQETNRKLKEVYMSDFQTGMYNRTGCENVLYERIKTNQKSGLLSILLFIDINRMKVINDKFGHLNGDLAIKATSDAIKASLTGDWLFGRYGGDEFIALGYLPKESDATGICDSLNASMEEYIGKLNLSFDLSASVGYTIINGESSQGIEYFIKKADDAMYEAKQEAHRRMGSN